MAKNGNHGEVIPEEQALLLTIPEVALWVRVHTKTVYRWVQDGKLKAFKFGPRLYRVEKRALEQFIEESGYGPIHNPPEVGPTKSS